MLSRASKELRSGERRKKQIEVTDASASEKGILDLVYQRYVGLFLNRNFFTADVLREQFNLSSLYVLGAFDELGDGYRAGVNRLADGENMGSVTVFRVGA